MRIMKIFWRSGYFALIISASAIADPISIPIGFISYDVNIPASVATFDITNETGSNASTFPDTTFPVVTPVNLSGLSLTVDFSDGSVDHFGPSYFTLAPDGLSFDGGTIPIGGANPQPTSATLTGTFSPLSITLNDGSTDTIKPSFSAAISPSSPPNLADGDFAVINATTSTSVVPEPSFQALFGVVALGLIVFRLSQSRINCRRLWAALRAQMTVLVLIAAGLVVQSISAAPVPVKLSGSTQPSSGVAGVYFVNVSGSGFPTGHGTLPPSDATISFALSCGGTAAATTSPTTITNIIGSEYRLHFQLPGTLMTETYFVSVSGATSDGTAYASINCAQVAVTHTSPTLSACVPTSSLGIVAPVKGPASVKALVPNGCWECGGTGLQVVQLETGGGPVVAPVSITTTDVVNSCAGNPATGEGVCVANSASVYHLNPSNTVTKLTSASNTFAGFSGGNCENCGVAVNALTNQAVIAMGHSATPNLSGTALQTLDLATNTFGTPLQLANHVSEDISIDPTRGFILTPNEASNYNIVEINSTTGAFTGEFGNPFSAPRLVMDSAAEDCATGIALTGDEGGNFVYLADLTQAKFTSGSPGSWTAPQQAISIIGSYSAGISGVTVAPGSSHLATVTGEFGGSSFSVLKLPSTSGTGTPTILDYAYVPCLTGFSAGFDPHTVSAYTSPNNGKAYTVFANWITGSPGSLYVADMAAILAAPREADGHTVIGDTGPGSCLSAGDGKITSLPTH